MDRIKEKIRERVLQQVPTGVDVDEKYLADAIDRVITEIGQEQYMRCLLYTSELPTNSLV